MATNKFNFDQLKKNFEQLKRELPIQLANQARTHFTNSFKEQGWEGKAWETPKRRIVGTPEYKYPKKKGLGRRTQKTLVKSGRLKRAVNMSVRSKTFEKIQFIVDVPYASYLNDGTKTIPARPFMKHSFGLKKKQVLLIKSSINKVFNV